MRLDKFLTIMGIGSRSNVKKLLKKNLVTVNEACITKPDIQINPDTDCIAFRGQQLHYEPFFYFLLNKPAGVVSATQDNRDTTVADLLKKENVKSLFPVGRLDKDTEGFLILTNDGNFAHAVLSPKKHVPKTYFAVLDVPLCPGEIEAFEAGLDIQDPSRTLPAKLLDLGACEEGYQVRVTITEGRYHQIKRMFAAFSQKVLYLKRESMGSLTLDDSLSPGDYRKLTLEEVSLVTQ